MDTNAQPDTASPVMETTPAHAVAPLATAAALDSSAFNAVNTSEAVPATWEARARKAWEYYVEEPLVKNCINSWRTFAVGDEIKITSDNEALKEAATAAACRLKVGAFVKDMILQLLVKGDAVGFKRYTTAGDDIAEVVCVNPVSVKVKYAQGTLMEAQQYPQDTGSTGEPMDLPVDQVIHLKWDAPGFSPRGNSLVLPAFQAIELLRDYRRAEQAIAKRWATPFRLLKVGGACGQKMVMPDQRMLEQVRDMVNKMDMKSGLVVPFYVHVETHGTDGQVLNVEDKVKEVKEDIVVALGLSRSLVTGDGPNFATASISMQKMMVMIREIKQAARQLLDWLFDDWRALHGYSDLALQFIFNDLDPSDAVDFKQLLIELYDRQLISRSSLQLKMELDPAIEAANRERERQQIDLMDVRQIKPVVDMVVAGIISVERARALLGLAADDVASDHTTHAHCGHVLDTTTATAVCGTCRHWHAEQHHCAVLGIERHAEAPACRFIDHHAPAL